MENRTGISEGTETEVNGVGRPKLSDDKKLGSPKQVTFTKADWQRVEAYMEAHDLHWMEFARAAILEKVGGEDG